jgi:hypothetical protein
MIDQVKKEYGSDNTLILNAGNNFDIEAQDMDLGASYIIKALALSGTEVIAPGVPEITCGPENLKRMTENMSVKVVSANLPDFTPYVVLKKNRGRMNILVTSVIDPGLLPQGKTFPAVTDPVSALRRVQQQAPHDLFVVIIHAGPEMIATVIDQCPGIDLVIDGTVHEFGLKKGSGSRPPVVANNNEGMYVAYIDHLRSYKGAPAFTAPVQLKASVEKVPEDLRVASMVKEYNVKQQGLLRQHPETVQGSMPEKEAPAYYVGSESCRLCHPEKNDCWANTRHAQALNSLSAMSRQNDPNCLYCHVTGIEKRPSLEVLWAKGSHLMPGVQCEACHGPGREHSENPQRSEMLSVNESTCTRCHTKFKDPGFDYHQDMNKLNCTLCQQQPRCKPN